MPASKKSSFAQRFTSLTPAFRRTSPIIALGLALTLAGCGGVDMTINGDKGVKLSDLDMTGNAPAEVALLGSDRVIIVDGDALDIQVEGGAKALETLRFALDSDTLSVMREPGNWSFGGSGSSSNQATIRITMPTPTNLTSAGSGDIEAQSLGGKAEVSIAGSGDVAVEEVSAETLDVSIAGSGSFSGAGSAKSLDLSIAGSGSFDAADLAVDNADISILGSGSARFASDGTVDTSVAGSGDVTVTGSATCETSSVGSGNVVCKPAAESANSKPSGPTPK